MGWLTPKEQRKIKKEFKVQALYLCDHCEKPIALSDFPVIDPKGGYHPWPDDYPVAARQLSAREPKRTYHLHPCNDELRGKRPLNLELSKDFKKLRSKVRRAVRKVIERLRAKPVPGYWTKKKLFQKLKDHEPRHIVRALRFLRDQNQIRKREGGYVPKM